MADNYLERRMEDMRSGRLQNHKPSNRPESAPMKKGYLHIPFPPRRVLVTGGAHGIGLAIARTFLKADCKVAVFDRDKEAGERLAAGEGVRFYHVDVSDFDAVRSAFNNLIKTWLDIDIIISNAGVSEFKPITECSIEDFKRILDINLTPAFILAKSWAMHREKLPLPNPFGGRMVIISSTRHIQSEISTEAYTASKGGLASLTHALMMSLSQYGITVNSISPGWINTAEQPLREEDLLHHPSRRVGVPEDIARVALFLSALDNNFINGTDIVVDGGATHRMIYPE